MEHSLLTILEAVKVPGIVTVSHCLQVDTLMLPLPKGKKFVLIWQKGSKKKNKGWGGGYTHTPLRP